MALLKAFVCQVILFGLYKLFLEQVVEEHLVPDELTRNCLVGFVGLLCFGIQLYTEKIEDQTSFAEPSKTKGRRWTPPDAAETVSDFMDARTVHMMRTLDAAMQQMNQMPMSDGYVKNVIFAAAGPEATVIEQAFGKQPEVVLVEEFLMTKMSDAINENEKIASEPIVIPVKVEENEEEESETKSDVCEEEEEDVVTVIDASKQKLAEKTNQEATESEEEDDEDEDEEEKEPSIVDTKNKKIEEKPSKQLLKEYEEESDEEQDEYEKDVGKVSKKS